MHPTAISSANRENRGDSSYAALGRMAEERLRLSGYRHSAASRASRAAASFTSTAAFAPTTSSNSRRRCRRRAGRAPGRQQDRGASAGGNEPHASWP